MSAALRTMLTAAVHFLCKGGWDDWQAVLIREYGLPLMLVIVVLPTTFSLCHMAADVGPLCATWRQYSAQHPSAAALWWIAGSLWHALCACPAQDPVQVSCAGGRQVVACSVDSVYDHLAWIHTPKEKNGLGGCCIHM